MLYANVIYKSPLPSIQCERNAKYNIQWKWSIYVVHLIAKKKKAAWKKNCCVVLCASALLTVTWFNRSLSRPWIQSKCASDHMYNVTFMASTGSMTNVPIQQRDKGHRPFLWNMITQYDVIESGPSNRILFHDLTFSRWKIYISILQMKNSEFSLRFSQHIIQFLSNQFL